MMKKSIVWVVLLAGVITTFNACEPEPEPVPAIVGTWNLSKYKLTELPAGFKEAEGYEDAQILGIEVGYTFVFKQDHTYSRSFNVTGGYPSITDQGTWEQDGTRLKVTPDDPDDLDLIEGYGTVGTEFDVEGDITEIRMELSNTATVYLLPDNWDPTVQPKNSDFKPVDVTLVYKFNKLN